MDCSECPGAGTLLGLGGAGAVGALGAGKNAAGSDNENVSVGELLLQLAGEAGRDVSFQTSMGVGKEDTYRCCTLWKPGSDGTGTKMMIALRP